MGSSLLHAGCLVVACEPLAAARVRDLVPQPGIKPRPPALGTRSLTHWTTREVPGVTYSGWFYSTMPWRSFHVSSPRSKSICTADEWCALDGQHPNLFNHPWLTAVWVVASPSLWHWKSNLSRWSWKVSHGIWGSLPCVLHLSLKSHLPVMQHSRNSTLQTSLTRFSGLQSFVHINPSPRRPTLFSPSF